MAHILERLSAAFLRKRKSSAAARIALSLFVLLLLTLLISNLLGESDIFTEFAAYLSFSFIRRALLVGSAVSLCSALLGVTLVLKNYSMIGDGLSHVSFGALSVAVSLRCVSLSSLPLFLQNGAGEKLVALCGRISENPMPFTLIIVIALAFLLLRMNGENGMKGDSAIAVLSTGSLALGILVTSQTSGMNVDVMNYMFGSILSMGTDEVIISLVLSACVIVIFLLLEPRIFAVTFDERFAKATGTRADLYNMLIAVLTAVTIVVGMRIMGTMLISSLIIFPAVTSMRVFSNFRAVLVSSACLSVAALLIGLMLSCLYAFPAGAAIVLVDIIFFLLFSLIAAARE